MSVTSFRDVLRVREFRWLWFADLQSLFGDQLARVALSVLVFERTGSGLLTAGVYALTYLPALIGSVVLGPLADRIPRRRLLVAADALQAVLLAAMAVPAVPVGAVAALLVAAVVVGTPWKAAESALVAEILEGEGYALGAGLRVATVQGAQLIGFAVGGAAVAVIGARTALAIDAVTFAISAVLIASTLRPRPAAGGTQPRRWRDGIALVAGDRRLRSLLGLSWLAGLFVVPEGLAAPYAAQLGGGAAAIGLLLAAGPAGAMVGSLIFVRLLAEPVRARLVGPFAMLAGVPLLACLAHPGLTVTIVLWALCGACSGYQVQVITEFVHTVPNDGLGQAIAVASAGLLAVQGVGLLLGGAVAQVSTTYLAVGVAGAAGIVLAGGLAANRLHQARRAAPTRLPRRADVAGPAQ